MRTIALEEHYATAEIIRGPGAYLAPYRQVVDPLLDLGAGRIAAMDAAGVDVAVLSLVAPGVEQLEADEGIALARRANDALAEAVRAHPDRLAGFAAVPTAAPAVAADELERLVRDHGFVGAVINGHSRGRYLDDLYFQPILERATALDVPIYLHPTPPPRTVVESCYAGFSDQVTFALATAAWGWHINTATHVLRLVLGGVFDRNPGLQVIIGHMGETLPFMLPRFDLALPTETTGLQRPVSAYLRENVHYTFANFNEQPTFANLIAQVGIGRVMFSTDHPFGSMAAACAFLDSLPIDGSERDRIAHGNAAKLLGL